ncbi:hypothetical protein C5167_050881 [Papaver somniferum]|uniref:Uncharacterized protein n=1 Tax=Papaver somniferum TaxID=3469 RepID=A0A4Y7KSR2_PAPSO|nr:hypothetical protein C5167_050881 [Papaver somniferum]
MGTLIAGICGSNEVSVAIELSMKMVNGNEIPVVHCKGGLIGHPLNFFCEMVPIRNSTVMEATEVHFSVTAKYQGATISMIWYSTRM